MVKGHDIAAKLRKLEQFLLDLAQVWNFWRVGSVPTESLFVINENFKLSVVLVGFEYLIRFINQNVCAGARIEFNFNCELELLGRRQAITLVWHNSDLVSVINKGRCCHGPRGDLD